jgi:nicotinamidase-related amidase
MTSVLLMVDTQRNMLQPPEPVPDAEPVGKVISEVLDHARSSGARVVHIRNTGGPGDPDEPGTDGWELAYPVVTGEHVVDKTEPDAFVGTGLADLVPLGARVVVVGMQSEYCLRSTALGALARTDRVVVVRGAHATYPDGRRAAEISTAVESELAMAGIKIRTPSELSFGPPMD